MINSSSFHLLLIFSLWKRPRDQRVMKLHCWEPLMINHHATKIGGHRHCGSGDIMILVCHMILQDHVIKCCSSLWLEASKGKSAYCYGAIIRTEIACNKKICYESILNSVYPRSRTQLYINKNRNISGYQNSNLQKIWFLFLVLWKKGN